LPVLRAFLWVVLAVCAAGLVPAQADPAARAGSAPAASSRAKGDWLNSKLPFDLRLGAAAEERARHRVVYDGTGYPLAYPMGDVPPNKGTCTDEVVRAFRLLNIDLQQMVHEDMLRNFAVYPTKFNLKAPDPNIDHRRVWNLLTFFNRNAEALPITDVGKDYKPGDVIIWDLDNYQLHIGMVTRKWSKKHKRPLIMHNISSGPHIEDKLFEYKILGHFRYEGGLKPEPPPVVPDFWAL
jgi:uncharacterized protein YijF (DUF1287 family)